MLGGGARMKATALRIHQILLNECLLAHAAKSMLHNVVSQPNLAFPKHIITHGNRIACITAGF